MKKLLCLIITIFTVVGSLPCIAAETDDPFYGRNNVTVVTLGGSLTAGDGGDYTNDWAHSIVNDLLPDLYPGHTYTLKNAGIGATTSEFGMYRFASDVAHHAPDLLVVEFCVNDEYTDVESGKRNMESILRQAMALPKVPYVIFVGTGTYNADNDRITAKIDAYKQLAEYYGIGFIDLNAYNKNTLMADGGVLDFCPLCKEKDAAGRAACEYNEYHESCSKCNTVNTLMNNDKNNDGDFSKFSETELKAYMENTRKTCEHNGTLGLYMNVCHDGTHPTAMGYRYWASEINRTIEANPDMYFKKADATKERLYTNSTAVKGLMYPKTQDFSNVATKSGNWSVQSDMYQNTSNSKSYAAYVSDTVGDKITFKFHGTTLSFLSKRGAELGKFKVIVDGDETAAKEFTQYYQPSLGYGTRAQYTYSQSGLEDTWHTAVIENIGYTNGTETISNVYMACVVTDTQKLVPTVECAEIEGTKLSVGSSNHIKVPADIQNFSLVLDGEFDNISDETVAVAVNGTEKSGVGAYGNGKYSVALEEALSAETDYVTVTFSTDLLFNGTAVYDEPAVYTLSRQGDMGISNLAYTDANGNQLVKGNISSAKMSVRLAPSAATEKANIYTVLVQKNSEGIIKDIKTDSSEITGGTYKDVSVTLENITVAEGDYLQTFIWENTTLVPYTESIIFALDTLEITQMGDDIDMLSAKLVRLSESVTEATAVIKDGTLKVSGTAVGGLVAVKVIDKTGNIVHIDTIKTRDGAFALNISADKLAQEVHTVAVAANAVQLPGEISVAVERTAETVTAADASIDNGVMVVTGETTGELISLKLINEYGDVVYIDTAEVENGEFALNIPTKKLIQEALTLLIAAN